MNLRELRMLAWGIRHGFTMDEVRSSIRWTKRNTNMKARGCFCGRPVTHAWKYHDNIGWIPVEIWSCAEHHEMTHGKLSKKV